MSPELLDELDELDGPDDLSSASNRALSRCTRSLTFGVPRTIVVVTPD
jgi:hypothetical protein